jgi:hypothetical protein
MESGVVPSVSPSATVYVAV